MWYCYFYFKELFNLKANVYLDNLLLSGKSAHTSRIPSVPFLLLPGQTLSLYR